MFTQAIKSGSFRKLKDSVEVMKTHAGSTCTGIEEYLNVCYLQSVVLTRGKKPTLYYMTLLSHAAVQKKKEMIKYLLERGASKSESCFCFCHQKVFRCRKNISMPLAKKSTKYHNLCPDGMYVYLPCCTLTSL